MPGAACEIGSVVEMCGRWRTWLPQLRERMQEGSGAVERRGYGLDRRGSVPISEISVETSSPGDSIADRGLLRIRRIEYEDDDEYDCGLAPRLCGPAL